MSESNIPSSKFLKVLSVWKETAVYFGLSKRWRGTEKVNTLKVCQEILYKLWFTLFFFSKVQSVTFHHFSACKSPKNDCSKWCTKSYKSDHIKDELAEDHANTRWRCCRPTNASSSTFHSSYSTSRVRCTLGVRCFCPLQTVPSFSGPEMQKAPSL